MTLEQRVTNLEKELADIKRQLEDRPDESSLVALRRKRLMQRLGTLTNPSERQAVLNAVARLDCYVQSLQQRFRL